MSCSRGRCCGITEANINHFLESLAVIEDQEIRKFPILASIMKVCGVYVFKDKTFKNFLFLFWNIIIIPVILLQCLDRRTEFVRRTKNFLNNFLYNKNVLFFFRAYMHSAKSSSSSSISLYM